MVKYVYDAWGRHTVTVVDPACEQLANLNPFRYRGYYYDVETGLYFLQTRYYDPETGRFISQDSIEYAEHESINGLNLYAYCSDNPIMYTDPNGTAKWWEWLLIGIGVAAAVVLGVICTVASCGAASPLVGLGYAVLGGALLGFAGAATNNIATQVDTVGWDNVDMKEATVAGLVGGAIGAVTSALSFGVGCFASEIGQGIGFALSKSSVAGYRLSKVFSTSLLMNIGGVAGNVAGGFLGSLFGSYFESVIHNQIFNDGNVKETFKDSIFDWIIQFITYMVKG